MIAMPPRSAGLNRGRRLRSGPGGHGPQSVMQTGQIDCPLAGDGALTGPARVAGRGPARHGDAGGPNRLGRGPVDSRRTAGARPGALPRRGPGLQPGLNTGMTEGGGCGTGVVTDRSTVGRD